MAIFQVCQPTGWTGLVVAWAVVRSLAGFVVAGPSGMDYLGGIDLPWLAQLGIRAFRYVDTHGLLLCGLTQIGSVVLLLSDSLAPHALAVCPWESHRSQRCRCVARVVCAGVACGDTETPGAAWLLRQRYLATRRLCGRSAH